ncbi:unnamed protein product [Effrenium voratum]|nr:unnamed protein product [Effrenium voratum]
MGPLALPLEEVLERLRLTHQALYQEASKLSGAGAARSFGRVARLLLQRRDSRWHAKLGRVLRTYRSRQAPSRKRRRAMGGDLEAGLLKHASLRSTSQGQTCQT